MCDKKFSVGLLTVLDVLLCIFMYFYVSAACEHILMAIFSVLFCEKMCIIILNVKGNLPMDYIRLRECLKINSKRGE